MAKMLKHLVFGLKKNPPAPPRPDYEGQRLPDVVFEPTIEAPFFGPDYENIPKCKSKGVQFADKKETQPELLVFDNYSEPADLRVELTATLKEEDDPLYMSPLDDRGTAPPLEEEDMYCVPYDSPLAEEPPPLPQPCFIHPQGYASHRLGRKAVLLYISVSFTMSWLIIAYARSLFTILVGRLVSGFCAGICSVAVPAYIVEISTVKTRGLLSTSFQLSFAIGVFLEMILGIFLRWSWLAVGGAVVVVISAYLMITMPESPPWLIKMCRDNEALGALTFLRGNAAEEFREIRENLTQESKDSSFSLKELIRPEMYKPLAISISLMFFQQFAGINALVAYSVKIFQDSKSLLDPTVAATLVALVQILATILSGLLMDKKGRKTLFMLSGTCMVVSLSTAGIYTVISETYNLEMWSWVPIGTFVTYMIGFSLGFGPIPFVVTPELVPIHSRSFLLSVASMFNSCFSFIVIQTFDDLRGLVGLSGVYWTYGAITLIGVLFYWKFVPETKGRTIDEIHQSFSLRENYCRIA